MVTNAISHIWNIIKSGIKKVYSKVHDYIQDKYIYRFIVWMKEKRYYIPVDTKSGNIVTRNTLVDIVGMSADWICMILILNGWSQHIVTYAGMITIAMYIFADHFGEYTTQFNMISKKTHICYVRHKVYKHFKYFTPDLWYLFVACANAVVLFFLFVIESKNIIVFSNSEYIYRIIVFIMLVYMIGIKTKHYVLDIFEIKQCEFIAVEEYLEENKI